MWDGLSQQQQEQERQSGAAAMMSPLGFSLDPALHRAEPLVGEGGEGERSKIQVEMNPVLEGKETGTKDCGARE